MYEWIGKLTAHPQRLQCLRRVLGWIPAFLFLPLIHALSWIVYLTAGTLKKRVIQNMTDLLPGHLPKEIHRLARHYFDHLFIVLYEIIVDSHRLKDPDPVRFRVHGEERINEALKEGKGVIIYTPHMGNFFYYYWYLTKKYDCLTVATAGSPELRPLYLLFQDLGCNGLDYDNTPPLQLIRTLRDHLKKNGVVFILGDFYRPNFPEATLFGRKTRTPSGAAVLALEQEAPVIPFYGYRTQGLKHDLVFGEPIHLHRQFNRKQRMEAIQALNREMENMIMAQPSNWFYWFNAEERWEK